MTEEHAVDTGVDNDNVAVIANPQRQKVVFAFSSIELVNSHHIPTAQTIFKWLLNHWINRTEEDGDIQYAIYGNNDATVMQVSLPVSYTIAWGKEGMIFSFNRGEGDVYLINESNTTLQSLYALALDLQEDFRSVMFLQGGADAPQLNEQATDWNLIPLSQFLKGNTTL